MPVSNTTIHKDAEGRFSLNDLHKASGGNQIHAPSQFLRNQQTIDLIAAIDAESDVQISASVATKKGGHNQGSYGAKELVYAYAMWISPKFHLQVIRTFDAMVMGQQKAAPQIPQTLSEALMLASKLESERESLAKKIADDAPKVAFYEKVAEASDDEMPLLEAAKVLGTGERRLPGEARKEKPRTGRADFGVLFFYAPELNLGRGVLCVPRILSRAVHGNHDFILFSAVA